MFYLVLFILLSILFILLPNKKISMKIINAKAYIFPCTIAIFLILIIVFFESAFESAHTGFMLWVNSVIPSLLPFFICIELIKRTNFMRVIGRLLEPIMRPLFNIPGCGAFGLAMGLFSGYPVGAKIASDLYEEKLCTKIEAERLLAFTNTSGPLFIIGAVGIGMFKDSKIGLLLFITHFLSAISVGLLFKKYKSKEISKPPKIISNNSIISQEVRISKSIDNKIQLNKLGEIMGESIKNSISTLLLIGGYIVFFSVLVDILTETHLLEYLKIIIELFLSIFNFSKEMSKDILVGIIEITNGIKNLSNLNNIVYIEVLTVVAFILGFGGFSVHMQVSSIIANNKLSMKPYLYGKLLQGIFASFYTYLLMRHTKLFSLDVVQTFQYTFPSKYASINSVNLLLVCVTTVFLIGIFIKLFNIPLKTK